MTMGTTKTVYDLTFNNRPIDYNEDAARDRLDDTYTRARETAKLDSNDDEIEALQELVDELLDFAGIAVAEREVPECDECEEEATEFWPNLKEPVQMCDSCTYNARRSGWEPGR